MKRTIEIVPEAGLHARPASKFVEKVQESDSEVFISDPSTETEPVNAESMLAITSLGLKKGEELKIKAEGEDAEETMNELEKIITTPEE